MNKSSWGLLVTIAVLCGCVEHRAVIQPPAETSDATVSDTTLSDTTLIAQHTYQTPFMAPLTSSSALPIELRATCWQRQPDGSLMRGDTAIATPRRWWQRFPADIFTDLLWPGTLTIEKQTTITLHPIEEIGSEDLKAAAIAAGYGGSQPSMQTDDEDDENGSAAP